MSMSAEDFGGLVRAIVELGYSQAVATRYAVAIGDTPVVDEEGRVVVMEGKKVVERLRLKFFEEKE